MKLKKIISSRKWIGILEKKVGSSIGELIQCKLNNELEDMY